MANLILYSEERRVCELVLEVPKIDRMFDSVSEKWAEHIRSTISFLNKTLTDTYKRSIYFADREIILTAVSPVARVDDSFGAELQALDYDDSIPPRLKVIPGRVRQLEINFPGQKLNMNEKVLFLLFSKLAEDDESILGN